MDKVRRPCGIWRRGTRAPPWSLGEIDRLDDLDRRRASVVLRGEDDRATAGELSRQRGEEIVVLPVREDPPGGTEDPFAHLHVHRGRFPFEFAEEVGETGTGGEADPLLFPQRGGSVGRVQNDHDVSPFARAHGGPFLCSASESVRPCRVSGSIPAGSALRYGHGSS
jgi:hypothetical protein